MAVLNLAIIARILTFHRYSWYIQIPRLPHRFNRHNNQTIRSPASSIRSTYGANMLINETQIRQIPKCNLGLCSTSGSLDWSGSCLNRIIIYHLTSITNWKWGDVEWRERQRVNNAQGNGMQEKEMMALEDRYIHIPWMHNLIIDLTATVTCLNNQTPEQKAKC